MRATPPTTREQVKAAGVLLRINARASGIASGAVFGLGLCFATLVLVWKGGGDVGQHLNRLSYVLPGYSVSYGGAVLGLIYGFFIGYGLGRLLAPKRAPSESNGGGVPIHVRLSPRSWGFTIGALLALSLFVVTNVLVWNGGENVGPLLGQLHLYFPGYSVDFAGSLIGCAYMLCLGWIAGRCVASIYNRAVVRAEA